MDYIDSPYKEIPNELISKYTMNNSIPILHWWMDQKTNNLHETVWTKEYIDSYRIRYTPQNIKANREGTSPYGHESVSWLLASFEKYNIKSKNVAVIGSTSPWIEAILLNLQNNVTTIEYNVPETTVNNLTCKDYFSYFKNNENEFDAIITYSSIEHSGLGRYGDPLDPDGDIKTMNDIHKNLKHDGILIWGAPVGADALVWNVHRIYGRLRLPLLFENFEELEWIGGNKTHLYNRHVGNNAPQPVVILKKI